LPARAGRDCVDRSSRGNMIASAALLADNSLPICSSLGSAMNRKTVTVTFGLVCFATGLAGAAEPAARRPNILFILADDQSYKTVACYPGAYSWVRTPNIDALAANGVRFERARSEEHTSELQSLAYLVCRLLLEKKPSKVYTRAYARQQGTTTLP